MDNLASFLKEQVESNTRKVRNTWVIGAVVVLLVVGYMSFLLWMVRGYLDPWTAAHTVASLAERNVPIVLSQVENSLRAQAPQVVDDMCKQAKACLPELRIQAEKQIDAIHESVLPGMGLQLAECLEEAIQEHKGDIAEFVKTHKDADAVKYFIDTIASDVVKSLDDVLQMETPGMGVNYFQAAMITGLQETKAKLVALSAKKDSEMSRVEALQKKVLITLVNALRDGTK